MEQASGLCSPDADRGLMNLRAPLARKNTWQGWRCAAALAARGHSLMVKLQPSKLAMRVRFPLPALLRCVFLFAR
jgi:hypothetical protein